MKNIFACLCIAFIGIYSVHAQTISTQTAVSFEVNGLKVIFKPTVKDVISVRMFFRGGVYNYPEAEAGLESFALKGATQCGTTKYTANAFRDIADRYGISIGGSSTYDYGNIGMDCVKKYFDQGWDIFAAAVNSPVYDAAEVSLLKSKIITQVNAQQSDPDEYLEDMLMKYTFAGTPYASDPDGDILSLTPVNSLKLKNYYTALLNKNRMFLVVAGNLTRQQIIQKVTAAFVNLPSRPYTTPVRRGPDWLSNTINTETRQLATNYITGAFSAPPINSADFLPYRMGIAGFSGSLFSELRTQLNLSYDPGASAVSYLMPYGFMHVSTNSPKDAVEAMVRVVSRVKTLGISDEGLALLKNSFITNNYIKSQGSSAITANLGQAEINGGWQYAEDLPLMLEKVTAEQINNALAKYITGIKWVYLGNAQLAREANDAFLTAVH